MTSFRFNFSGDDTISDLQDGPESIKWLESEEILPNNQIIGELNEITRAKMFVCGDTEIGHVVLNNTSTVEKTNENIVNPVTIAQEKHSDLIAGTYEGGLKIWECTYDLIEHLESQTDIDWSNKRVLDLGCGIGILGIYALLKGSHVTFQDYNSEVLKNATIPSVLLNIEDDDKKQDELKKCKFFSGDWSSFSKKIPEGEMFDIIITSETIYNENNYDKLINLFIERLDKNGIVFLAAKTYYFGVGGGIRQFEQAILKNGHLKSEISWKSTGGIQREILKLTHNKI